MEMEFIDDNAYAIIHARQDTRILTFEIKDSPNYPKGTFITIYNAERSPVMTPSNRYLIIFPANYYPE